MPTKNMIEGIQKAFPIQKCPIDAYFADMAEADWRAGRGNVPAVKSFFVRRAPFKGSFGIMGGVSALIVGLEQFRYDDPEFMSCIVIMEMLIA